MMEKKLGCFQWIALCSLLLASVVSSKHHGNPANDLVDVINKNRTGQRLKQLNTSPGLGCMALQYAEQCNGNCTSNNTLNCHPPEDDFTEVFAPNCGVELPTLGTISGLIVGCQHKYLEPLETFSHVLVRDKKTLSLLSNKTHSEVGVGMIRTHKGSYWCVLFSSSSHTNSSFVLEALGHGIKQKKGCFSGTSTPCSSGRKKTSPFFGSILIMFSLYICLVQDF
ncbi:Sensitive to high expression protein [Actinidia chinensis var. chinensis]|uniref:Sensitive to high expression protein n=1 Tax=Actinidia chinensis var. chinensis TaxID=1590841 RepID=A0A2R6RCY2_ACTCC|nr:Sensitive to high expression protein [Actinidia chinensis var. chinensis]